jgi:hypothetical protein
LSKSKRRTGHAIVGARVAPSSGKATGATPSKLASLVWSLARVAPSTKGRDAKAGPHGLLDRLTCRHTRLSHQVTKVHTFSFFATPVILPIVAQTGYKQGKHASFPPEVSSPHFLVFSYSFGAKSHFKRSEKSTHLLAPCDHNCARKAHKPAFPDPFLIRREPAPLTWPRPLFPPN